MPSGKTWYLWNSRDFPTSSFFRKFLHSIWDPRYQLSNAINEDGTYTDGGWYICEEEEKALQLNQEIMDDLDASKEVVLPKNPYISRA